MPSAWRSTTAYVVVGCGGSLGIEPDVYPRDAPSPGRIAYRAVAAGPRLNGYEAMTILADGRVLKTSEFPADD